MSECRPFIVTVPEQNRSEQTHSKDKSTPWCDAKKTKTVWLNAKDAQKQRRKEKKHGIFAKQANPKPEAGGKPLTGSFAFKCLGSMETGAGPTG